MFLSALIVVTALASALLFYAASRHCLWSALHARLRSVGRIAGTLLLLVSLGCAGVAHGFAAGLCIVLAAWMIGLVGWPYLAWATHTRVPR